MRKKYLNCITIQLIKRLILKILFLFLNIINNSRDEIHNYFSHLPFNVIDFAVRDIDEALNETGAGIADNVQYVLAM